MGLFRWIVWPVECGSALLCRFCLVVSLPGRGAALRLEPKRGETKAAEQSTAALQRKAETKAAEQSTAALHRPNRIPPQKTLRSDRFCEQAGQEFRSAEAQQNVGCSQGSPTTNDAGLPEGGRIHAGEGVPALRGVSRGNAHFLEYAGSRSSRIGSIHLQRLFQSIAKVLQEFLSGQTLGIDPRHILYPVDPPFPILLHNRGILRRQEREPRITRIARIRRRPVAASTPFVLPRFLLSYPCYPCNPWLSFFLAGVIVAAHS